MKENFIKNNKQFLLLVILVLSFYLSISKVILPTYRMYRDYNKLKNISTDVSLNTKIKLLSKKISILKKIIRLNKDDGYFQQEILAFASHQVNELNINIISIKQENEFEINNIKIVSNFLIVQGNYFSLEKLLYIFEKKFNYSKLTNVKFYIKKDYNSQKNKLYAKLLFQNFIKVK